MPLTVLPLSFALPSTCLIIGKVRPAFPLLEEAFSSGSFAAFAFSLPAASFESSFHLSSLETPLEPCVVLLVVDPEGVLIRFMETFLFILDPISFVIVQVALIDRKKLPP